MTLWKEEQIWWHLGQHGLLKYTDNRNGLETGGRHRGRDETEKETVRENNQFQ